MKKKQYQLEKEFIRILLKTENFPKCTLYYTYLQGKKKTNKLPLKIIIIIMDFCIILLF